MIDEVLEAVRLAAGIEDRAHHEHGVEVSGPAKEGRLFRVVQIDLRRLDDLQPDLARRVPHPERAAAGRAKGRHDAANPGRPVGTPRQLPRHAGQNPESPDRRALEGFRLHVVDVLYRDEFKALVGQLLEIAEQRAMPAGPHQQGRRRIVDQSEGSIPLVEGDAVGGRRLVGERDLETAPGTPLDRR